MKIVDVCAFLSPHGGGVKTYIEQKLAIGPRLGHEIVIIAPGDRDEVIVRGPGAKVVQLASPRFPLDRKYWYFDDEARLHAALDAEAPDFVEASSPWRSASMVGRWPGAAPRALVMHADPLSAYAYRWFGALLSRETIDRRFEMFWDHLRELGQSFDRVVCASGELQARLAEGGVANTSLHPMGVEPGLFLPERRNAEVRRQLLEVCDLPETAHLLIAVGRLSPEKRWPMVIDAVAAASRTLPIGLIILGGGRQKRRILAQIAGNPHIRLLTPERNRVRFATLLASADALIHGCEAETFCMAAAEARACGVPVIVPDRGGAADHARGGAGVIYEAGNAQSAAEAILALLSRPEGANSVPAATVTMEDHFAGLFNEYDTIVRQALVRA
ncbi:glycosyltransferase [Novosphingobium piscinae]|uniref:Glycosyltransferase n=1 Tax=Novosphingobium piscinae TaxID=1507448 RepID=A0A7X1FYV0_9SPHN|nr:glycosyltransferase [Novosphingobium piscinae]MBC2669505.1 glycosyltransferase [Novosphingobium piscinae]